MFWLWLLLYGLLFAALNIAFGGARPGAAETVYLLFAVFGEEVLFRGVLPAVWGEKLGAAGAAAASAAPLAGAFPPPRCRRCAPSARGCC